MEKDIEKNKKIILIMIGIFAILSVCVYAEIYYYQINKVVSVITMDINPSIAISLNKKNVVLKVESLNEDAKGIIKDNNFKGKTLETTISNISETLVEEGYITKEDNSILINVEGKSLEKSIKTIENKITNIVTDTLKEKKIECNVIIQEVTKNANENAKKYGISDNKASYIEDIINNNEDINFEDLKDKTINEINNIIEEKKEEKKKAEETKKIEEAKIIEEEKKSKNNNSQRYGSDALCENVKVGLTNEEASAKCYGYLNKENPYGFFMDAQTIASRYNGICAYETKVIHNKKMYIYYHNITTGELIYSDVKDRVAGTYEDVKEIVTNYFQSKYSAIEEEIHLKGASGTVNEFTKQAQVEYNEVIYNFVINATTGEIISVIN